MSSEKFPICNINIELTLQIEPILNHPAVKQLFKKLQENKIIKKETSHQDWVKTIVEDYKNKARETTAYQEHVKWVEDWKKVDDDFKFDNIEPHAIKTVKFRIKDNLSFINDEINFGDFIYHEIFIPYQLQHETKKGTCCRLGLWCFNLGDNKCIHYGIKLRVFIANGIIKLQIGAFSIETSPDVISEHSFQQYITITSFPLFYYPSIVYQIPESHLQANFKATDSFWKKENKGECKKQFSDIWEIDKEIRDFYLISEILTKWDGELGKTENWEMENEKKQILIDQFNQKAKEWLARECFEVPESPYGYGWFHNKYLSVQVENLNSSKEKWGNWLSDYIEIH